MSFLTSLQQLLHDGHLHAVPSLSETNGSSGAALGSPSSRSSSTPLLWPRLSQQRLQPTPASISRTPPTASQTRSIAPAVSQRSFASTFNSFSAPLPSSPPLSSSSATSTSLPHSAALAASRGSCRRYALICWLVALHLVVLVVVLSWLLSLSSSRFGSGGDNVRLQAEPLSTVNLSVHYSSPVSILALSKKDRKAAEQSAPALAALPSSPPPAASAAAVTAAPAAPPAASPPPPSPPPPPPTPAAPQSDGKAATMATASSAPLAVAAAPAGNVLSVQPAAPLTLPAAKLAAAAAGGTPPAVPLSPTPVILRNLTAVPAGSSLLDYLTALQTESCKSPSFLSALRSSGSASPPAFLVYSCQANAAQLEHGDEQYEGHSIAALPAMVRAQTLALATQRTLLLDSSGCDSVRAMPAGEERDAGLLCCDWEEYFLPLSSCALPETAVQDKSASAFTAQPVVLYDARQQCLWGDELWLNVRRLFPAVSQQDVVRTITASLLRPSSAFASHLEAIGTLLPPAAASPLLFHVLPFTPEQDRELRMRTARSFPISTYLNVLRFHSPASPSSSLILLADPESVTRLSAAFSHLHIHDLLALVSSYWKDTQSGKMEQRVAVSAAVLASTTAGEWVGAWSSVMAQVAVPGSPRQGGLRLWSLDGELWSASCWSSALHLFSAHHAAPAGYNIPAMSALLSSAPAQPFPALQTTQIVVVVGGQLSGVEQLNEFLLSSAQFNLRSYPELNTAYSSLFGASDYSVANYMSNRTAFVSLLSRLSVTHAPPSRLLLTHIPPASMVKEKALLLYHQPSFLAGLISSLGLPLSLHVVVLARHPNGVLADLLYNVPHRDSRSPADPNFRLLPEGKTVRDVLSGIDADCKAMDVSAWRVFDHERLFKTDVVSEGKRLAQWLQVDGDVAVSRAVAELQAYIGQHSLQLMPPQVASLKAQEQAAVVDLFANTAALQIFNGAHPAYSAVAYDHHRALASAVAVREAEADGGKQLLEHVAAQQADAGRCTGKLLVFDGMKRWSSSLSVSSQVLDLLRALTLALTSGRLLVVPPVPGSVTDFLQPLASCPWSSLGMEVTKQGEAWTLSSPSGAGNDAFGSERVVLSHSQLLDLSYLAAWNAKDPARYLNIQQYIGTLLRFLLRSPSGLQLQSQAVDVSVSIPAVVNQPLSFYAQYLRSLVSTLSPARVRLSSALHPFQHVASSSFLPQVNLPLQPEQKLGSAMVDELAQQLRWSHPALQVDVVQRVETEGVKGALQELLQAQSGRLVVGSMGTEEGFLLSGLVPPERWYDLFAYQFVPSLLALNDRAVLTTRAPSLPQDSPEDPTAIAPVVLKTIRSDTCRFLFIAGLEGTGHHGIGHLLASLRLFSETGVRYERLQADEHLSGFAWKMMSQSGLVMWDRTKRQLAVRLKWRLQMHTAAAGAPIYVINSIQDNEGGMQSWPNTDFPDKASLHSSLAVLLRIFQEQKADIRILALARTPGSSLSSTIKRRHAFAVVGADSAFYYQARVLRSNLAALDADMSAIDPAFVLKMSLESLQTDPVHTIRAIGRHIGLGLETLELEQAGVRQREEVTVYPSNHWMTNMNQSEVELSDDMLSISDHLPLARAFRFIPGRVGGKDEDGSRRCWKGKMRLRHVPKPISLVSLQGAGADYVRLLIEEGTGVLSSSHVFDRALPSSSSQHMARFVAANLVSFTSVETPIVQSAASPALLSPSVLTPTLLLTRNPLDLALSYVFPAILATAPLSSEKTLDFTGVKYFRWKQNSMGAIIASVKDAIMKAGDAYVHWAQQWKAAERRKEMLEHGRSRDGVVVMRMEDLIATAADGQALRELAAVFDLPAEPAAAACVAFASGSVEHPPRLFSSSPSSIRTLSNHYLLNISTASIEHGLLSASFLPHSTSFVPFTLAQLISPDTFNAFRRIVDATAVSIEGQDWVTYCDEVLLQLQKTWKLSVNGIPGAGAGPIAPRPNSNAARSIAAAAQLNAAGGVSLVGSTNLEAEIARVQGELKKLEARGAGWESSQTANRARARLVALRQQLRQQAALKEREAARIKA